MLVAGDRPRSTASFCGPLFDPERSLSSSMDALLASSLGQFKTCIPRRANQPNHGGPRRHLHGGAWDTPRGSADFTGKRGWVVFLSEPISICTLDHDLQLINFCAGLQPAEFGQNGSLSANSFLAAWMAVLTRASVPRWYRLLARQDHTVDR